jgi:adenylyltransferase/sulfurtransferase
MFTLSEHPLNPERLADALRNPGAGALVTFDGWVRDHHGGRRVLGLAYEAFPDMAVGVGNAILEEARRRFAILDARVEHRIGEAAIGERVVWVGVAAEHRQEAFLACRWIMDRIKADVPIWKKERYAEGDSVWVHAAAGNRVGSDDPAVDPRYSRQVVLPRIGADGQRRLAESRVLVIGAGGLGCPALLYLAAAGVGNLTICDGDRVEESNLHRQPLYLAEDVGLGKADRAADRLRAFHPRIALQAVSDAAEPESLPGLVQGRDLVLDCTDSFESKYAIHDACYRLQVPLVQAAVYQFDGWVQVIDPRTRAGCMRCLWPEPPPAGCVGNCAQAGVLGVTPGLLGMYQAIEALKLLLDLPERLDDATLYIDVLSGESRRLRRPVRAECPCRGRTPWPDPRSDLLYPGERANALFREAVTLDIREPVEREGSPDWIQRIPNVPRAEWDRIPERYPSHPVILCCSGGLRTRQCLDRLGHPPGIYAWSGSIHDAPCGQALRGETRLR